MNNLRVLDINDALLEGTNPFRTLQGVTIEFDDNKNCIYACEKEYCLVQAYYNGRAVILKINLNDTPQQLETYEQFYLDTTLYKTELRIINIRNKEVFVDVLLIDDEPQELLSFLTPNSDNKDVISAFIRFLISLHTERVVIDGLSFDGCLFLDDKVMLSPVKSCTAVCVDDTEVELITAFKNFTTNMLAELLSEISGDTSADNQAVFQVENAEFFNDENFVNSIDRKFSGIERLILATGRGEIIEAFRQLENPASSATIQGGYSEDRIATYDPESEKWGYLNLKGEVKVPFLYDIATPFYEDIAVVKKDGFFGSIDRSGKQCLGFTFQELSWQGQCNLYIVRSGSLFGVLDRNGKTIVEECYRTIGMFQDGCAVVQSPDTHLFGAINSSGDVIIKPVYDKIETFENMRTVAVKDGKSVVLDIFGDKI